MIRAMIFDLDGTLVKTEELKAHSYAEAVAEMAPGKAAEAEVVAAYREVVGKSREEVAAFVARRFGIGDPERLTEVREQFYQRLISNPAVIRAARWPHTIALLKEARRLACKVGLASMSMTADVMRILGILHLAKAFDFIAGRDAVKNGKPDPEIYLLVAAKLAAAPEECLVIEDSATGVAAALAAGMKCIAVGTPFTGPGLHAARLLDERWIVDEPSRLPSVLREMLAESSAPETTGKS